LLLTHTNGNDRLILDAGSGLMLLADELRSVYSDYPRNLPFRPNILLSHLHLDHINGLTGFLPLWAENTDARLFTCSRGDAPLCEQIFGAFTPPYWPISLLESLHAQCVEITDTFEVDGFIVTPFAANHPDKTQSFHITDGSKSIVYLLDNEMPAIDTAVLLNHCKDADLVVFDASYLPLDYPQRKGYGHATVLDGIKLANDSGCKRMVFAHYAQDYTDKEIDELKTTLSADKRFLLAREGLEIEI